MASAVKTMFEPAFSVVVNTANRAEFLADTLTGLLALDYPECEIVVVNGPSTDDTESVLERFASRIKIGRCPELNLSVSRNAGIALAAGDIVAFIDDDAVPHPSWLRELAAPYQMDVVGAVGGFTLDRSGVRWQVRKTVCDRYGAAYNVSDFFDERPLNQPGSPYYPSLLGTNCSFRRRVLEEIGGFDDVYAYLLDETDVCLRIVDAGYHVLYQPSAIVFHKGASSDRRSTDWTPKTLLPSVRSTSYFINRHGRTQSPVEANEKLKAYEDEIGAANRWLGDNGRISAIHRRILDDDLAQGVSEGVRFAREKQGQRRGDLVACADGPPPFIRAPAPTGLRIVMVSRGYPPTTDAGIARWTSMVACGLAKKGHEVHVVTEAKGEESVVFESGLWLHRIDCSGVDAIRFASAYGIPEHLGRWAVRVRREIEPIKTFGPLVVSFPIWDLEGIGCLDDPSIGVVMSLHTSYALAKPFKPEWSLRPLLEGLHVNKTIAGEARALRDAPVLLANSKAIVEDMERAYGLTISDRVVLAPHGTLDILRPSSDGEADAGPLRVLFVGRNEARKGFDLAIRAAIELGSQSDVEFHFVGGDVDPDSRSAIDQALPGNDGYLVFHGVVDRAALDDFYNGCDVVLMPSRYESFGLVAIEAMAAGKPVIALKAGGLKEVVTPEVDGVLIEDDENAAGQIAAALRSLSSDRKRLKALARGARRSFETRFTVEHMVNDAEKAYLRAAELKRAQFA